MMNRLRQALHQRQRYQRQLHAERTRALAALVRLRRQYRSHPVLPLAVASGLGLGLGRAGSKRLAELAIINPVVRSAWHLVSSRLH
ncbi:MAG TPA: hypothetical protein VFG73_01655 [Rhodanobacteraceae bacterium]|nr:hypothetical protein [Rhodanobacteraceae bacterium]